jgi:beta-hydroxyacyl-ACP dehydratase FabZ
VDRITDLEFGKRVVGIKNVTCNEPFFQGHFPDTPIMPGVLILEAMAQVGGILARLTVREESGRGPSDVPFFVAMDKVKFRKPVVPGDQMVLEVVPLRTGSKVWKVEAKAFVGEALVAQAELTATLG